MGAVDTV
jgi:hypothetical protein